MEHEEKKRVVVGIVQARMGASRLPNKMMLHLHGYPVIEWVYRRCSKASALDALVFALPDTARDDLLASYLEGLGANIYRGSENDVLGRFHGAALAYGATHVVRICADNPLVSPVQIDELVSFYSSVTCDYAYNHIPLGNLYPDGLGAEMTSFELIDSLNGTATAPSQREHLFNFIWDHPGCYTIKTFDPSDRVLQRPDLKLDIDTLDDYRFFLAHSMWPEMSDRDIVCEFGERA